MESVVAALLRDFEGGKLSRRQLVQTLALMAVGSPVASAVAQSVAAAPAKAASGTPWKTAYLDHISFQVSNYKRSTEFYTDLMGWKVLKDTGTQADIDINGIGGIIIRNRRRPADAAGAAAGPPNAQPGTQPPAGADSATRGAGATMEASYPSSRSALSVVTPGINMPVLPISTSRKSEARAKLGLPATSTCLLFVGNDYRKKGLEGLLRALTQLPHEVMLAVVGNPAHIAEFRALADTLKLGARVLFLGALKDVGPAYEAADALVHPTFEDTFAMVVLEAMAHGLPVVVSGPKYCGIAGLLEQGANALLLDDPRDAGEVARVLGKLLGQAALRETLSRGAAAFAQRYQWREIALQQEALYFSAVAAKNASA